MPGRVPGRPKCLAGTWPCLDLTPLVTLNPLAFLQGPLGKPGLPGMPGSDGLPVSGPTSSSKYPLTFHPTWWPPRALSDSPSMCPLHWEVTGGTCPWSVASSGHRGVWGEEVWRGVQEGDRGQWSNSSSIPPGSPWEGRSPRNQRKPGEVFHASSQLPKGFPPRPWPAKSLGCPCLVINEALAVFFEVTSHFPSPEATATTPLTPL